MIVYHPRLNPSFKDFGLDIPMENSRWERTWQELRKGGEFARFHYTEPWAQVQKSDLLLAHDKEYIDSLFSDPDPWVHKAYEGDCYATLPRWLPLRGLLERAMENIGGTLTACQLALSSGWAYFMGGGMHHALSFTGQGFCLLNDVVLALRILQQKKRIARALIIDVDVHKGDGMAEMTKGDDSIVTMSLHGDNTWPLIEGNYPESFLPNNWDIAVSDSREYLPALQEALKDLGKLPGNFDLCLVVQGADPFEGDALASTQEINLTLEEMQQRDQMIHRWLHSRGVPQAYCMGGGYGENTWKVYLQYLQWALMTPPLAPS